MFALTRQSWRRISPTVGGVSEGVLTSLATWYSRDMLFRALSILKADYRGKIKTSPIKAYLYVTHTLVHEQGKEWISDCGKGCRYRVENKVI